MVSQQHHQQQQQRLERQEQGFSTSSEQLEFSDMEPEAWGLLLPVTSRGVGRKGTRLLSDLPGLLRGFLKVCTTDWNNEREQ